MNRGLNSKLIVAVATLLIGGCGGGEGEVGSSTVNTVVPPTPIEQNAAITFAELQVPDDFDWQNHSDQQVEFRLVSRVSQIDGEAQAIAGQYVINIYALDAQSNLRGDQIFSGMTNQYGVLTSQFFLPPDIVGIETEVFLPDGICSSTLTAQQLQTAQSIGCDVLLASDL
jgi:hypothetical protein